MKTDAETISKLMAESGGRIGRTRMPIHRIYHIHRRLLDGGFPNCTRMAEELEVNRKTVQRDINYMRDMLGMPLDYDANRHGYYYTEPVETFPPFQIAAEDLAGLFLARTALRSIRGTALADTLRSVFARMTRSIEGMIDFSWSDLDDAFSRKSVEVAGTDLKRLGHLAEAVLQRRTVTFRYRKLGADRSESRRVDPYHLGEVDGGHYLIGWDRERDGLRTFALPRMSGLRIGHATFPRPADFSGPDHLRRSFGIWSACGDGSMHLVRVELRDYAARLVQERRWHPSQEVHPLNAKATRVEVRFEVGALEEVVRWVLSWGGKAKVLAPPELKRQVAAELREMMGN